MAAQGASWESGSQAAPRRPSGAVSLTERFVPDSDALSCVSLCFSGDIDGIDTNCSRCALARCVLDAIASPHTLWPD
eukprot:2017991-Rhodomonas_salina.3